MTKTIMIQGTCSDVGKSIITTGLCKIFSSDGYKVAPFKAQNISQNSYDFLQDGAHLQIAKSVAIQAFAAGVTPSTLMNPVFLKTDDDGNFQPFIDGKLIDSSLLSYYKNNNNLKHCVSQAFNDLSKSYDIIVIEGAGSPAEINLKDNDIANMFTAKLSSSPVILVGDIEKGGVFASIAGTMMLIPEDEKALIKGVIINKFMGDISFLKDGISSFEKIINRPVLGVVPHLEIDIEKEDSAPGPKTSSLIDYSTDYLEDNLLKLEKGIRASIDINEIYRIMGII